ncbi:MAG: YgfZ/GcvT domain-containing protein [Formosimonas sp.]
MNIQTSALPHLGLIRVTGADARSFLHSQLTQDVLGLADNQSKLAGYCSAKGRLYAVFQMFSDADAVFLITQRELIEPVVKRLRMFVLRAKVVFEDVSDTFAIQGVCASDALAADECRKTNDGYRVGVLPASQPRELRIAPQVAELDSPALWDWLNVSAGQPQVTLATYEAFVPQMINLDRVGGVNFKKGCYPGQEVVARSHYLGKLKRRMQAASLSFDDAAQVPAVGVDVLAADGSPVGQVVTAAAHPQDARRVDVLFEVSLPALADGAVLTVAGCNAAMTAQPLPYTLSDATP